MNFIILVITLISLSFSNIVKDFSTKHDKKDIQFVYKQSKETINDYLQGLDFFDIKYNEYLNEYELLPNDSYFIGSNPDSIKNSLISYFHFIQDLILLDVIEIKGMENDINIFVYQRVIDGFVVSDEVSSVKVFVENNELKKIFVKWIQFTKEEIEYDAYDIDSLYEFVNEDIDDNYSSLKSKSSGNIIDMVDKKNTKIYYSLTPTGMGDTILLVPTISLETEITYGNNFKIRPTTYIPFDKKYFVKNMKRKPNK